MEVFHERQPIEDCCMQFCLLWGLHDITEILLKVALNKHHILLHYKGRLSHLLIPCPNFDKFFLENITQMFLYFWHLWVSFLLCLSDQQHKHTLFRGQSNEHSYQVSFLPGRGVFDIPLCDKICQWLATGQWFSQGTLVSSTKLTATI